MTTGIGLETDLKTHGFCFISQRLSISEKNASNDHNDLLSSKKVIVHL